MSLVVVPLIEHDRICTYSTHALYNFFLCTYILEFASALFLHRLELVALLPGRLSWTNRPIRVSCCCWLVKRLTGWAFDGVLTYLKP